MESSLVNSGAKGTNDVVKTWVTIRREFQKYINNSLNLNTAFISMKKNV